jgi:hypothetical protein
MPDLGPLMRELFITINYYYDYGIVNRYCFSHLSAEKSTFQRTEILPMLQRTQVPEPRRSQTESQLYHLVAV